LKIAVIGGGPAGLRAAEIAVAGGASVTLFDAKASAGRKLLVAGRGGLNLTKDEPLELFVNNYQRKDDIAERWAGLIAAFVGRSLGSADVCGLHAPRLPAGPEGSAAA
jgi:hypothetical protein